MSIARNGINGGHFYSNVVQPLTVELNFIIDPANGNGLGQRSLKSNGFVEHVFMHTTATPAAGSPNPAAGTALIQMKFNSNRYLGGTTGFVSPASGTPILVASAGVTAGVSYIIVSLGTTSVASWHLLGVPAGVTPAVGVSFVATSTQTQAGTGAVETPSTSGIFATEVIGDPNLSTSLPISPNAGQFILVQFLNASGAQTAPATGSVCGMTLKFDQSSVTVDGQ